MFKPTLEEVTQAFTEGRGNTVPIYSEIPADLLTPVAIYLKVSQLRRHSFLLESVAGGEKIGRYSFVGADPYKTIRTGTAEKLSGDPLRYIEQELADIRYVPVPGLPAFTGGAVGFISFDCIQHFEPHTKRELRDPLGLPESEVIFCETLVVCDHLFQRVKVISHVRCPQSDVSAEEIARQYALATDRVCKVLDALNAVETPVPPQSTIVAQNKSEWSSNVGKDGYKAFVTKLKEHIKLGDIIQAVPSQRISRPTQLHPFNVYRQLRMVNPSPYMFYFNFGDFQLVGASPEMLVKVENRVVYTNPIAGTRRRGKDEAEDQALEQDVLSDPKERAEHVMLVDLGRNDVNRVCRPETVTVDSLMHIERYSHVMHIVSNVSGTLRDDQTSFDAFRSIFPAGTVSGAPKIRAVELVSGLEGERRGVYAGSVGHFNFSGDLDTCIAIRTMVFKDGIAYLQAGGGIVFDSDPEAEYEETINKLGSNLATIAQAEEYHQLRDSQRSL
ncbi:ADC synthase [Thamnocephalis sphaerospora]|uniref:anthranilate synthase n=1 Tax=Thamnocephalis sphaerospora TaxID=78915 RepID=A0A4P9XM20_9FUNG|nr:ADC synthase [Thamnocephalis sphaerospora]|eukprot:RKP06947.1 ADC synthase [Thamnocephalis sphaerospora]